MIILAIPHGDPIGREDLADALEGHCRTDAYAALIATLITTGDRVLGHGYEIATHSPEALDRAREFLKANPEVARHEIAPFVGWWAEVNRLLDPSGELGTLYGQVQRYHRAGWTPQMVADHLIGGAR